MTESMDKWELYLRLAKAKIQKQQMSITKLRDDADAFNRGYQMGQVEGMEIAISIIGNLLGDPLVIGYKEKKQ